MGFILILLSYSDSPFMEYNNFAHFISQGWELLMSEFLGMSTNTWQHLSRTDHGFIFQSRVNVLVKSTGGHELLTC